jgi:hypothetical protein
MKIIKGEGGSTGMLCMLTGVTMPGKCREKLWIGHIPWLILPHIKGKLIPVLFILVHKIEE